MVEDNHWGRRSYIWIDKQHVWIIGANLWKEFDIQISVIFFGNCDLHNVGSLTFEYTAISWE
jgi:hypothetical protein